MKKRLCMLLATILMLTLVTPAFAVSNAQNEDEYTFAVEQGNGTTVCMAVSVENGIPRRLTESEYRKIMEKAAAKQAIADNSIYMLEENGAYDTNAVARRGITYSFTPTSAGEPVADYSLKRRVSQVFKDAESLTVTSTTSYERTVTKSSGLTITNDLLDLIDTAVEAKYSYTETATSSTSTSIVGTLRPPGVKPYAAVAFTPYTTLVEGVMTQYMSAMGSSGGRPFNCTIKYPLSVNGFWDGIYEVVESYTGKLSDFPPAA